MIDPDAKFSDDEIRHILSRAADKQEEADRAQGKVGTGLTLHHLSEIAREAGIAPSHVTAAAKEVMLDRALPPQKMSLGLPTEHTAHRVLPGSFSDAQWEKVVTELRTTFGKNGIISNFGDVREWISSNASNDSAPIRVRLAPTDEGTEITINQQFKTLTHLPFALGGTFTGISALLALLITVGNFEPQAAALPIFFGLIGLPTLVGGFAWAKSWARKQQDRFKSFLDRVELIGRRDS